MNEKEKQKYITKHGQLMRSDFNFEVRTQIHYGVHIFYFVIILFSHLNLQNTIHKE